MNLVSDVSTAVPLYSEDTLVSNSELFLLAHKLKDAGT